ncbi:UNVERIFIED_CONTAM: hypothetical protein Sradi_6178400 [Sesamum radiatum]|uniref:Retrotransposon Copia-like N-terminal domain-containing protein n=1 Tax=Sesamum radiatum TaxID=300843 RepID=A0AAW2K9Q4_SESRA
MEVQRRSTPVAQNLGVRGEVAPTVRGRQFFSFSFYFSFFFSVGDEKNSIAQNLGRGDVALDLGNGHCPDPGRMSPLTATGRPRGRPLLRDVAQSRRRRLRPPVATKGPDMASPSKQDAKSKKVEGDSDHLRVQITDNPGTILVSNLLDGTNFLSWSRSIKIALRAKMKLGFINGKIPKPEESDDGFEQWERADGMVISWILNSISKDIVESFLYIDTARDLWLELETRFGVSNGPLVYKLQREIASAAQGNLSVSAYFSNLKKLWDELGCLVTTPAYSSVAAKEISDLYQRDHLMQFLMGLDESFENIRNQILIMEPLPNVSKAYAIVLQVERQKEVNPAYGNSAQNIALQAKAFGGAAARNQWKKKGMQDK